MLRQVVSSQIIHSVGFVAATGRLEIRFQNGWIYEYDDVPEVVYRGLMSASSHGKYLKQQIVDKYVARRIQ